MMEIFFKIIRSLEEIDKEIDQIKRYKYRNKENYIDLTCAIYPTYDKERAYKNWIVKETEYIEKLEELEKEKREIEQHQIYNRFELLDI